MTKDTKFVLKELREEISRIQKMVDLLIARETGIYPQPQSRSQPQIQIAGPKIIIADDSSSTVMIERKDLEKEISSLMRELGIPSNLSGYQFIRSAVLLILQDKSYLKQMTKALYPDIAKHFHSTPSRVERSIRHCIKVSFDRGNSQKIEELFAYTVKSVTNSEFLSILAEEIERTIS